MVFFGEYQLSFTSANRLVLPKRIRELLKGNIFILTKGFDFCLAGYDKEDWETRANALFGTSLLDKENLAKQRLLFSSTSYLEIDDQGRFVIPKNLIEYANLKKDVVILGVGDHFEIWSLENWKKYEKANMNLYK